MAIPDHVLIRNAGSLWDQATHHPFLDALAAGSLVEDAFRRWLAQDYLFAKDLMAFQAILLAKAPRDCHKSLIGGLAALEKEMDWFESHAVRLQLNLDIPPHPTCRRYTDFLMRCAVSFRCACVARQFGCELRRIGSLSHVFRKQGIHIIADPVTEVVADAAYFIEPGD